jgi:outer membrane protein OmpA-like peptidoglycan-associated protein
MTGAVAGGDQFQVNAEVKFYPSELHVPMHRPDAPLTPERLTALTDVLRASEILFPAQSREVQPEQTGKLEQAARAMRGVGARVHFVVGGFYVAGDGSASQESLARNRAEVVAGALASLGVAPEQMEVTTFALPPRSEAPSSQKVEIRVR